MEHRTLMRRRKQRVKYVLQTLHVVGLNRLLLEVTIRGLPTTIKESFVADVRYRLTELSPGQANGERKGQPAVVNLLKFSNLSASTYIFWCFAKLYPGR
uniref:Uncharacterized protein n=1 Tax=Helianthus annuus TaxID=4232 RepID=A0A251VAQ0_HELAN